MQQQPNFDYGTFPCPHCGAALPGSLPAGTTFPCFTCTAQVTAPPGSGPTPEQAAAYMAWSMTHANTAIAQAAADAPQDPARKNFSVTSEQVLIRTAQGKLLVIGSHVDAAGGWALRAQDLASGELVWETAHQFQFSSCPGLNQLAERGGMLFFAQSSTLTAFEAHTGRRLWSAELGASVETRGGFERGDFLELELITGAVVVRTDGEQVLGLSPQSGQVLWRRGCEDRLQVTSDLAVLHGDDRVDLVNGAGQVVATFDRSGKFGHAVVAGPCVIVKADEYNDVEDDEGLLVLDGRTGALINYFSTPKITEDHWGEQTAFVAGQVAYLAATNMGTSLLYLFAPTATPPDTKPGFFASFFGGQRKAWAKSFAGPSLNLGHLTSSADALIASGNNPSGGDWRVIAYDSRNLSVRYDSGPLPFEESSAHEVAGPHHFAYRTSLNADHNQHELHVVNSSTGQAYKRSMGRISDHCFYVQPDGSEQLVVYHEDEHGCCISVLRPADGQLLGSYPKR